MAISTQDPARAGDDFIPLGGDEDINGEDASSPSSSDSSIHEDSTPSTTMTNASFHPSLITLHTFRALLSCYPTTVSQVHRRKIMVKLQPKPAKGSKAKAEKRAGSASAMLRGAKVLQRMEFNPSELKYISEETGRFLELDAWRYEVMPGVIGGRMEKAKAGGVAGGNGEGAFLDKDELIKVMEWKTKHGLPRPTLMGMVRSNQNKSVVNSTSSAIAALPKEDPLLSPNEAFPKASLDALAPLRGVGTATASLILSIATGRGEVAHQVPFYSDDVYLWLCLKDFPETEGESRAKQLISSGGTGDKPKKVSKFKRPNGELNVKYNLHEYRKLWDECLGLLFRLNHAVEEEAAAEDGTPRFISHNDIEKVAYVLRNIAVSGFYPDVDPEDILYAHALKEARGLEDAKAAEAARVAQEEGEMMLSGTKRKREEKEEKQKKQKKQKQKGGRN